MYIKWNRVEAMGLKEGDRVRVTHSSVEGREGTIYTVKKGRPTKAEHEQGIVDLGWLEHCDVYGDRYEIVTD